MPPKHKRSTLLPAPAPDPDTPFWRRKALEEMSALEWESLCDGCGRCCLNKLEEEGTGRTVFTDVACRLLDEESCRCTDYADRARLVEDCVQLTPQSVRDIPWLPPTCAYRLVADGRDLYWWHPLVSGDPESVHAAGVSVRGRVGACETQVPDAELEKWIVRWPGRVPKGARANRRVKRQHATRSVVERALKAEHILAFSPQRNLRSKRSSYW